MDREELAVLIIIIGVIGIPVGLVFGYYHFASNEDLNNFDDPCIDGVTKFLTFDAFVQFPHEIIERVGPENVLDINVGFGPDTIQYIEVCP